MALPDFVIIGAMKCGTSTLASQLGAQPGIFMSTPKEPNFYSDDAVFARGMGWYRGLFDAAPAGALLGEASTHYTKLPTYPQTLDRFSAALEAPKLIYLIRDPVARAVSHYIHEWSEGVIRGDIEPALERHPELIDYGRYAMQLEPWIATYGTGNILVSSMEAMRADPQAVLTRVGMFLGCEGLVWQEDLGRQNVSSERIRKFPMQRLLIDHPLSTWLRQTLVPQSLRDRIKQSRQMQSRPAFSAETTARLRQVFAQDRDALLALFPGNPDLDAAYAGWGE